MYLAEQNIDFSVGLLDLSTYDVKGLVHSTETNGGFKECRFTVDCNLVIQFKLGDKVVLYDKTYTRYPFVGRVQTLNTKTGAVTCTRSTTDQVVRFSTVTAQEQFGPQTHPTGIMAGKVYPSGTPYLTIIQEALTLTPSVFDGAIADPGLQIVGQSVNIGGYTFDQILNYISSLTQALTTPYLWHIYGDIGPNSQELLYAAFMDGAARYFVQLEEDQIDESWDLGAIINRSTVVWGNDDVETTPQQGFPVVYSPYMAQVIRDKYTNGAGGNIARRSDAQGLADNLYTRFSQFRSVNDTLTINCNKNPVRIVPPLVTSPNDNWPLHLMESGHVINLLNRPANKAPYNPALKFITSTEYTWDTGTLVCRCGDVVDYGTNINNIVDYNVNRLFYGPASGAAPRWINHPLADADKITYYGPSLSDQADANPNQPGDVPMAPGIPMFTSHINGNDPYGKLIHPGIIPDEGLEANFNIPVTTTGFGGGIRVIPGRFSSYKITLGNSTGKVADTVVVELYKDTTGGPILLTTLTCTASQQNSAIINPPIILGQGDLMLFKVTTAGTTATWAVISLHATKQYPGLKI